MQNFTESMKQQLETYLESGHQVSYVAYNPTTEVGTPEQDAINAGWTQYYREATTTLVEVIYTK